jgi:hypothetical protein
MKIAVLLTGQLRTIQMTKYIFKHLLFDIFDTDVFMSVDLNNSLQCEYKNSTNNTSLSEIEQIVDFLKPINYLILDDFDTEYEKLQRFTDINISSYKLLFQQYYVVSKAYELLKTHINLTNKTYDYIIRLRFDQFIWTDQIQTQIFRSIKTYNTQIIYDNENIQILKSNIQMLTKYTNVDICQIQTNWFNEVLPNHIYLFGFGQYLHYSYANDQFWYHDNNLIDIMSDFYNHMLNILTYCMVNNIGNNGAMIECMFENYLKQNKTTIKQSNVKGIFIREFI